MNLYLFIIPSLELEEHCGDTTLSDDEIKDTIITRFHLLNIGRIRDIKLTKFYFPEQYVKHYYTIKCYFEEWYDTEEAEYIQRRLELNSTARVLLEDEEGLDSYNRCSNWRVMPLSECGAGIGYFI